MIIFLLIVISGALAWFFLPAIWDIVQLKRQNARIQALTKQTKRDMDNLARRQRQDEW